MPGAGIGQFHSPPVAVRSYHEVDDLVEPPEAIPGHVFSCIRLPFVSGDERVELERIYVVVIEPLGREPIRLHPVRKERVRCHLLFAGLRTATGRRALSLRPIEKTQRTTAVGELYFLLSEKISSLGRSGSLTEHRLSL